MNDQANYKPLTGFERFVLGAADLSLIDSRKIIRQVRRYAAMDSEAQSQFIGPYRKFGRPILAWTVLKMSVHHPTAIVVAPIGAALCYLGILLYQLYLLVQWLWSLVAS